jgi:diguanylate cyclase (GGDEF)-like protein
MLLDATTLVTAATCVTGLLGILLLAVWLQERNIRALAWWGAAYLMGGSAVALWGTQETLPSALRPFMTPETPNALLFIACGVIWSGARLFHGRSVLPAGVFAGAALWLLAAQFPAFADWHYARVVLSSCIIASYTFLTSLELRRERRRPWNGGWLALGVPLLHGAVFLSPILLTFLFQPGTSSDAWFALFALQTLLYVVGTAFIVVVMAKEHVVLVHKTAAMTDPLTGLFNRRAFFEAAHRLIAQQARKGEVVSVLGFDLDHFKSINDRFGHATGDDALRLFAATASGSMRATDVIGRLGGEEFVAILPSPAPEAAIVGERVRGAFEAAGIEISGHRIAATVSIGVASATPGDASLDALLARADAALYRAKTNGRNRVEISVEPIPALEESAPAPAPDVASDPRLAPAA